MKILKIIAFLIVEIGTLFLGKNRKEDNNETAQSKQKNVSKNVRR